MSEQWIEQTIAASGDFANMRAQPSATSALVDRLTTPQSAELDLLNILTEDAKNPAARRWFHFRQTQPAREFWLRSDVVRFVNPLEARVAALEQRVTTIENQHP